jgi:phosphoribosylamine--glycine ligase
LLDIFTAVRNEKLSQINVEFSDENACCVIMASDGYPQKYNTGYEISLPEENGFEIFIAGAKNENGKLLTSGGRVLGVTAKGSSLEEAIEKSYKAVEKISFENAYYRKDIGQRALKAFK